MNDLHQNSHRIALIGTGNGLNYYRCLENGCRVDNFWVKEEDKPRGTVDNLEGDENTNAKNAVEERLRNGWKPHWGFACWYRGQTSHHSYGLPGLEREPLTKDEAIFIWGVPANGQRP